jgi:hypothetical protein
MKKNVAHQVVGALHRIYIPRVNEEIHNSLSKILPELTNKSEDSAKLPDQVIANAFNVKPNLRINVQPISPKDAPHVEPEQKQVDAKEALLEKMRQAKENK